MIYWGGEFDFPALKTELAELKSIKVLMLNNNQVKGDFANLERKLPHGVQFEYRNLDKMKNSVLATND